MDNERWQSLLKQCAEQALDECGEAPTIQAVALRAATLAAEAAVEAVAEEQRLAEEATS